MAKYKRVLLKLSGEAMSGEDGIINFEFVRQIADVIKRCSDEGVAFGIVIGGGNIWRGAVGVQVERSRSDHMGMLATVINSLAMQDMLIKCGVEAHVMTALDMQRVAESYSQYKANEYLDEGKTVIIACGTGNPYFSTDTGALLRAAEIHADVALLAKNIDGVYDSDPKKNPSAVKYDTVTYEELLEKNLRIIDSAASSLGIENNIKSLIFALKTPENIYKAVMGEDVGTIVKGRKDL
jgi:uridylate kinase